MATAARTNRRSRSAPFPAPGGGTTRPARGASPGSISERPARPGAPRSSFLDLLDLLGRRWCLRILWELSAGPLRFTEVQSRCDAMSPSVLNQRLSDLVGAGFLHVRSDRRYELTADGSSIVASLRPLEPWSRRWARKAARAKA